MLLLLYRVYSNVMFVMLNNGLSCIDFFGVIVSDPVNCVCDGVAPGIEQFYHEVCLLSLPPGLHWGCCFPLPPAAYTQPDSHPPTCSTTDATKHMTVIYSICTNYNLHLSCIETQIHTTSRMPSSSTPRL